MVSPKLRLTELQDKEVHHQKHGDGSSTNPEGSYVARVNEAGSIQTQPLLSSDVARAAPHKDGGEGSEMPLTTLLGRDPNQQQLQSSRSSPLPSQKDLLLVNRGPMLSRPLPPIMEAHMPFGSFSLPPCGSRRSTAGSEGGIKSIIPAATDSLPHQQQVLEDAMMDSHPGSSLTTPNAYDATKISSLPMDLEKKPSVNMEDSVFAGYHKAAAFAAISAGLPPSGSWAFSGGENCDLPRHTASQHYSANLSYADGNSAAASRRVTGNEFGLRGTTQSSNLATNLMSPAASFHMQDGSTSLLGNPRDGAGLRSDPFNEGGPRGSVAVTRSGSIPLGTRLSLRRSCTDDPPLPLAAGAQYDNLLSSETGPAFGQKAAPAVLIPPLSLSQPSLAKPLTSLLSASSGLLRVDQAALLNFDNPLSSIASFSVAWDPSTAKTATTTQDSKQGTSPLLSSKASFGGCATGVGFEVKGAPWEEHLPTPWEEQYKRRPQSEAGGGGGGPGREVVHVDLVNFIGRGAFGDVYKGGQSIKGCEASR